MISLNYDVWSFNKNWCRKNLRYSKKFNLDVICKAIGAHEAITSYIVDVGHSAYDQALLLNSIEKRIHDLDSFNFEKPELNEICNALECFSDLSEWENLFEEYLRIKVYNHKMAPEPALIILGEIDRVIVEGYTIWKKYKFELVYLHRSFFNAKNYEENKDFYKRHFQMELSGVRVKSGYIYVFGFLNIKKRYKIGFSSREPYLRMREVSKEYGEPLELIKSWNVKDPYIVEQRIHYNLKEFRFKRELFDGEISHFLHVIEETISQ